MASLERRGDKFRIVFRYAGQKYQHPVRTRVERERRPSGSGWKRTRGCSNVAD